MSLALVSDNPLRSRARWDQVNHGLLMWFPALALLDADLLAQRHQIEIHPLAVSTSSEKIKGGLCCTCLEIGDKKQEACKRRITTPLPPSAAPFLMALFAPQTHKKNPSHAFLPIFSDPDEP
jgi:hypothetical protein